MDHPIPPESIPMQGDYGWYVTLIVIGVIAGSVLSVVLRAGLFRSIIVMVLICLVGGLVLEYLGITLPFEPALRRFARDITEAVGGLFDRLVSR
jgi:hypothetical protein